MKKVFSTNGIKVIQGDFNKISPDFVAEESVDLVIADPPFGIRANRIGSQYNRNSELVVDGYVEIDPEDYTRFTIRWLGLVNRFLRPGGSVFVISGYSNLHKILRVLRWYRLEEVNHLIWHYNFGVRTTRRFVSSHYHILYYSKPGGSRFFNPNARFDPTLDELSESKRREIRSLQYRDMQDVWVIKREYKKNVRRTRNALPEELIRKIILYASRRNDLILDPFLGSFITARVAGKLDRRIIGFEISEPVYEFGLEELKKSLAKC